MQRFVELFADVGRDLRAKLQRPHEVVQVAKRHHPDISAGVHAANHIGEADIRLQQCVRRFQHGKFRFFGTRSRPSCRRNRGMKDAISGSPLQTYPRFLATYGSTARIHFMVSGLGEALYKVQPDPRPRHITSAT